MGRDSTVMGRGGRVTPESRIVRTLRNEFGSPLVSLLAAEPTGPSTCT